ncbi:MAG: 2,3-bisphosphoglycerate-independent phosphoglycerate mutase [candidate division Zixibacteria bacterium]
MILLCILDGFGLRSEKENNAVAAARKPNLDKIFATWPGEPIDGSGLAVGLPKGQMGNSEVGHLNLGAGRVVYQDITRIDKSIDDGSFFKNEVLVSSIKKTANAGKAVHLIGLVSDGCVHSSMNHLDALIRLARDLNTPELYLHAFLDGRDTSPTSGAGFVQQALDMFEKYQIGSIATIMGRYWGMDRDKRWDRIERAYRAIALGEGKKVDNPIQAIKDSYKAGVTDEFVEPTVLNYDDRGGKVQSGDLALFFNFRADRVRQLNHVFEGNQFLPTLDTDNGLKVNLVNMTIYDEKLKTPEIAFSPRRMKRLLGELLAENNLKQLRIAETEKYAHVTYFFNGGNETPFPGEDRELIQSPKVATYDLQPEMSALEVTSRVIEAIESDKYEVIVLNFANCDMVGHTGIIEAAVKAVETVDDCVGKVLDTLISKGGMGILTADHGNAEMMVDPENGGPHTAHTTNLVPCHLINGPDGAKLRSGGKLADIAPTMLQLLNIKKPIEMDGESLLI